MKKNILLAMIIFGFDISASASAAPKKIDSLSLTDDQLRALAVEELRKDPQKAAQTAKGKKIVPLAMPQPTLQDDGLISTADVLREERNLVLPDAEFELGAQQYLPEGVGHISDTEKYPLRLQPAPMMLLGFRKWMYDRPMNQRISWRAGASIGLGATSHETQTTARNNVLYKDIMLRTLLASAGPEAEIFLTPQRNLAFGSRLAVGRLYTVQAAPDPRLNRSENLNFWESSAYLRFQPMRNFFVKASFARRNLLGKDQGLLMQQDNWAAFLGYAL